MAHDSSISSRLGNLIKGGVAVATAGLLALSCSFGASQAYATDKLSTYYDLPTKAVSFQHQGTGNNGSTYTYEYASVGSSDTGRVAPMAQTYYETVGLNYINAYKGTGSIFTEGTTTANGDYTQGTVGSYKSRNATLGIDVANNVNPDEYMLNYCAWANGATVNADSMALDHGNGITGAVSVTIGGTSYADFPRAVYMECNILNTATGNNGNADNPTATDEGKTAYGDRTYQEWIDLENQRANRPKTGTYNPYYATLSATYGGAAKMVKGLHTLASAVDAVVAQSVDSNGNYTIQSRYGGNTANGTVESVVNKYEDVVQATQYYTLSKIEDGTIQKAVTAALVGYDPATGNYACRKYGAGAAAEGNLNDPDGNYYGGRVANYLADISTSITELGLTPAQDPYNEEQAQYIVWYTPEQIVANCDAAFVCDAYSTNSISQYLAADANGVSHTVYFPGDEEGREPEDNSAGLVAAREKAITAGTHAVNICFSYPANMFGNFYAQGLENGMLGFITSAFTYPQVYGDNGLTDLFGYWAKNLWHIKDGSVQSIVTATTSGMSLYGTQVGTLSTNYEANAEKFFSEGNKFYIAHQNEIDTINGGNLATYNITDLIARTPGAPAANSGAKLTKALESVKGQKVSGTAKYTKKYGAAAFNLDASALGGAKLSYESSDKNIATVSSAGKVTIKGVGTANITVTASDVSGYRSVDGNKFVVTVKVNKAAQPMTMSAASSTKKVSATALKAKKVAVKSGITVKKSQGAVSYSVSKVNKTKYKSRFTISKDGSKITVSKGSLPKATYKVTVKATAKGNANYAQGSKTAVVKIKVS